MVGKDKDLNDSEEGYLNPEDLSIIDEKIWELTRRMEKRNI